MYVCMYVCIYMPHRIYYSRSYNIIYLRWRRSSDRRQSPASSGQENVQSIPLRQHGHDKILLRDEFLGMTSSWWRMTNSWDAHVPTPNSNGSKAFCCMALATRSATRLYCIIVYSIQILIITIAYTIVIVILS